MQRFRELSPEKLDKGAAAGPHLTRAETAAGPRSGPNSAVRLFSSIFYKIRWGFSLLGGLTLFHRSRKAGKRLPQGVVAHVEQGQLVPGKACPVCLHLGHALGLGLRTIIGWGRGFAPTAKELQGTLRQGQAIGIAGLLYLGAKSDPSSQPARSPLKNRASIWTPDSWRRQNMFDDLNRQIDNPA